MSASSTQRALRVISAIMQSTQRMMGASARWEAVVEAEEVGFIDAAPHLGHRALDNFILQRRNAKGPVTAASFGNLGAAHRMGPAPPKAPAHRHVQKRRKPGLARSSRRHLDPRSSRAGRDARPCVRSPLPRSGRGLPSRGLVSNHGQLFAGHLREFNRRAARRQPASRYCSSCELNITPIGGRGAW